MLGVENTKSKYLMRLDGDDWMSACLTEQNHIFEIGFDILNNYNYQAVTPFYVIYKDPFSMRVVIEPQGAGIMYKRNAFLEVGGYDVKMDVQADLDFYIRFSSQFNLTNFPLCYRWNVSDQSRSMNKKLMLEHRDRILKKYELEDWEVHHFGAYAYV
jgi:hypothetical protein